MEHELPIVPIERDHDAFLSFCPLNDSLVRRSRGIFGDG